MMYDGTEAFFKEYQERAKAAGVDPLGYYLGGWGYATSRCSKTPSTAPRASRTTRSRPT